MQYGVCLRCGTTVKLTTSNSKEAWGTCPVCKNQVRAPKEK